jgi:hypothetical protein
VPLLRTFTSKGRQMLRISREMQPASDGRL